MRKIIIYIILTICSVNHGYGIDGGTRVNIIYIGNSITYGVRLEDRPLNSPAAKCSGFLKECFDSIRSSNCAISGRTTLDFLPPEGKNLQKVIESADEFSKDSALMIFSIKLGTNDSAVFGPNGSPVAPELYNKNLENIICFLLDKYPQSKVITHYPIWYSPNTHNRSKYMEEGLLRLQSYFPEIDAVVDKLKDKYTYRLYVGDRDAFGYFREHYMDLLAPENGRHGIFYLHPNLNGAEVLGHFWAKAICEVISNTSKNNLKR